jgi:hypothetical protein
MYFALRARRKFINGRYDKANAQEDAEKKAQEKACISAKLEGYSRMSIPTMGAISVLFALLLVINPIVFAGEMGTGAVLVVAGAAWVFWGSVLVYFGQRVHLLLLVLAVLWVALCSLTNDNHDLRTVTPTKDYTRPTLSDALKDWHDRIAKKYPGAIHPLYIVAAEGGGIRAAYWTAAVLGTIQDEQPAFADHVFAISGVSGGSLGAAVFVSLLPDGRDRKDFARLGGIDVGPRFSFTRHGSDALPRFSATILAMGLHRAGPGSMDRAELGKRVARHDAKGRYEKPGSLRSVLPRFVARGYRLRAEPLPQWHIGRTRKARHCDQSADQLAAVPRRR